MRVIILLILIALINYACEKNAVSPENKIIQLDLNVKNVSINVKNIKCKVYKTSFEKSDYWPQYNHDDKDTVIEISSLNLQFSTENDTIVTTSNTINFKYNIYKNEGPSTSSTKRNLSIEFDFTKKLITSLKASIASSSSYGPGSWSDHDQRSESNSKSVKLTNLPYIVDSNGNISVKITSFYVQGYLQKINFGNNYYNYDWDMNYSSTSSNSKQFLNIVEIPDSAEIKININK